MISKVSGSSKMCLAGVKCLNDPSVLKSFQMIWKVCTWLICDNLKFGPKNDQKNSKIALVGPKWSWNDLSVLKLTSETISINILLLLQSLWVVTWQVCNCNCSFRLGPKLTKNSPKWPKNDPKRLKHDIYSCNLARRGVFGHLGGISGQPLVRGPFYPNRALRDQKFHFCYQSLSFWCGTAQVTRWSKKCPFRMIWKVSDYKCPDSLQSVWMPWKCPNNLEWKLSRSSTKCALC